MTEYRINDLERLSGIKAHTIRIWEKRYQLIEPLRTSTNRRTYSSEQLIKLMNVSTLLGRGYKISAVAAMSNHEIQDNITALHDVKAKDDNAIAYISELTVAMLGFNEVAFEKTFNDAIAGMGFFDCMLDVIYPLLRKTGLLWRTEKVLPIQEHFASNLIKRKLMATIDSLPSNPDAAKKIVFFLPPEEWHELGLLFACYMAKSHGHQVIYLGQSVPMEDVAMVVKKLQPNSVVTFYIAPRPAAEIYEHLSSLNEKFPLLEIFFSGDSLLFKDLNIKTMHAKYLSSPGDLIKFL